VHQKILREFGRSVDPPPTLSLFIIRRSGESLPRFKKLSVAWEKVASCFEIPKDILQRPIDPEGNVARILYRICHANFVILKYGEECVKA
jgi:hypothetical protein